MYGIGVAVKLHLWCSTVFWLRTAAVVWQTNTEYIWWWWTGEASWCIGGCTVAVIDGAGDSEGGYRLVEMQTTLMTLCVNLWLSCCVDFNYSQGNSSIATRLCDISLLSNWVRDFYFYCSWMSLPKFLISLHIQWVNRHHSEALEEKYNDGTIWYKRWNVNFHSICCLLLAQMLLRRTHHSITHTCTQHNTWCTQFFNT